MKYIYSTSQMSKLSLILHTFSITSLMAGLFLIEIISESQKWNLVLFSFLFLFYFRFIFYF